MLTRHLIPLKTRIDNEFLSSALQVLSDRDSVAFRQVVDKLLSHSCTEYQEYDFDSGLLHEQRETLNSTINKSSAKIGVGDEEEFDDAVKTESFKKKPESKTKTGNQNQILTSRNSVLNFVSLSLKNVFDTMGATCFDPCTFRPFICMFLSFV